MRHVDVKDIEQIVMKDQPSPMLDWVRIDRMVIDDTYQRELGRTNWTAIRKIAADFRWSRFSPVLLAPSENGKFAIIDGQHRVHAAAICGMETVPAMIIPIERSEQAAAFTWVNAAVTRISPHHIYKSSLASGEKWAVTARDAVEYAGCKLMTFKASTTNKKVGEIYCIGLIGDLVKKGHVVPLRTGLKALREYDADGRIALYSDYIIRPFVTAMIESPRFCEIDLVSFLKSHDPFKLLNAADVMLTNGNVSGSRPVVHRNAFTTMMRRAI